MPTSPKFAGGAEESADTGIMWGAIIGGALAAIGFSLILAPIGAALGFAELTPWHHPEAGKALPIAGAIWLIIVQWLCSGLGGYLTGRLRTEWVGAHTHEVFFRDTVHGFLSWALVSVIGIIVMVATATHAAHANGTAASAEISPSVLLLFSLSMFVGAFVAAAAGALGGHDRDRHYATGSFGD
jgi:hypothetical protein